MQLERAPTRLRFYWGHESQGSPYSFWSDMRNLKLLSEGLQYGIVTSEDDSAIEDMPILFDASSSELIGYIANNYWIDEIHV